MLCKHLVGDVLLLLQQLLPALADFLNVVIADGSPLVYLRHLEFGPAPMAERPAAPGEIRCLSLVSSYTCSMSASTCVGMARSTW